MRYIISPAKKMRMDEDTFPYEGLPQYLSETKQILQLLQGYSMEDLQKLWKCNDSIAKENEQRIRGMNLEKQLTPAILAYEGIQYQYMAATVFEQEHFSYIQEHLRILSGFYGILKPFDGVRPYRLEMGGKLSVNGSKHLYDFWGSRLADTLGAETKTIINLASKEYSKAIIPHLSKEINCITIVFGVEVEGKLKEKATLCKMARGLMIRWAAEQRIQTEEDLKAFDQLDFQFSPTLSQEDKYIFIQK